MNLNILMVKKWHTDNTDSQAKTQMGTVFFIAFCYLRLQRSLIFIAIKTKSEKSSSGAIY